MIKSLLTFTSLALALTLPAQSCVRIFGSGDSGLGDQENFTYESHDGNPIDVCSGSGHGGSGNIPCNQAGYLLQYSNFKVGIGGTTDVFYCNKGGW